MSGFNIEIYNIEGGLEKLESSFIEHALKVNRYNQSKTAKALGISRGTLRTKLKTYFPNIYIEESAEEVDYKGVF